MLGHCGGKADLTQLSDEAITEISTLGLVEEAETLKRVKSGNEQASEQLDYLYQIPIPILTLADFQTLFPEAVRWKASYKSVLADDYFWLPNAVRDFFNDAENLPTGAKKLWVIRADEAEGREAILPKTQCDLTDISKLRGFHLALLPPNAGLIAMPDLERMQIHQQLEAHQEPMWRKRKTPPVFLPCSHEEESDSRKRAEEPLLFDEPWETKTVVAHIIEPIHRYRPDMQCLWTLGMEYENSRQMPGLSNDALTDLEAIRKDSIYGHGLHRIQFLFPYLRSREQLYSATGLLAGRIASKSIRSGTWRSIAGTALPSNSLPYPEINHRYAAKLRDTYGLGLIIHHGGRIYLDDERLASPYTPKYGQALRDDSAQRSGEFVRFMGYLQRQLRRLGENVLFSLDPRDPRLRLLLEQFFSRLYELGALRGVSHQRAYSIEQVRADENILMYEIQIAPAFPIDQIRLSFSHQLGENSINLSWER